MEMEAPVERSRIQVREEGESPPHGSHQLLVSREVQKPRKDGRDGNFKAQQRGPDQHQANHHDFDPATL
jgi:hypothetical protein